MDSMLLEQPQSEREVITRIERLEQDVRDVRRRVEHARTEADKRTLNKQLGEVRDEIQFLAHKLRP